MKGRINITETKSLREEGSINLLGESNYQYSSITNNIEEEKDDDEEVKPNVNEIEECFRQFLQFIHWKSEYSVYLCITLLIASTALERVTFKIMVDRMLPYKFVLIEIIVLLSCCIFFCITSYKKCCTEEITHNMHLFPHSRIVIIALLDSITFIVAVYSAAGVSPTMTVILMHASTLFIVLGSKIAFPNRYYGRFHTVGVLLISLAIVLSIFKIIWDDYLLADGFVVTQSSCCYLLAAAFQGASTLYKEKALVDWSQPISIYYLSMWLFGYQSLLIFVFLSLFYLTEEYILGSDISMQRSLYYGWSCFLGHTPHANLRDDDNIFFINCSDSTWLILGYVLATFTVLASINVVLQYHTQVVSRSISAAIFTAFMVLWIYDLFESHAHPTQYLLGGNVGLFDVFALCVLLAGMEVYARDPEPDVELITHPMSQQQVTQSPASVSQINQLIEAVVGKSTPSSGSHKGAGVEMSGGSNQSQETMMTNSSGSGSGSGNSSGSSNDKRFTPLKKK